MSAPGDDPAFGPLLLQDGSRCDMPANRSECEYCVFHAQTALRRLSKTGGRPDLARGGRSYSTKAMHQVAKRGEWQAQW